ncbi:DNA primase large subunit [Entamoeba marina]
MKQNTIKFIQCYEDIIEIEKQPPLSYYKKFERDEFIRLRETLTTAQLLDAVSKRVYIYYYLLNHYSLPLTSQELLVQQPIIDLLPIIAKTLPLRSTLDRVIDVVSHDYLYLSFHSRQDIFHSLETLLFFHRLYLTTPLHHYKLLPNPHITNNPPFLNLTPHELVSINFQYVYPLLSLREFVLNKGFFYIPSNQLITPCLCMYAFKHVIKPKLGDVALLGFQHNVLLEKFFSVIPKPRQTIISDDPRSIQDILKVLPPCIYHIHTMASEGFQMRYEARKQIVIFMKNAGVSVEECTEYMRKRLTKMRTDSSEKKAIRILYTNINFQPMSCSAIQNIPMKSGEFHGCILNDDQYKKDVIDEWIQRFLIHNGCNSNDSLIYQDYISDGRPISPIPIFMFKKKERLDRFGHLTQGQLLVEQIRYNAAHNLPLSQPLPKR